MQRIARCFTGLLALSASAQVLPAEESTALAPASADGTNAPAHLPAAIVTAQKGAADAQSLPVSVTAVTQSTLDQADIVAVKQAAVYAPNSFINEFSSRALSNPFFRGVGGSPLNPGVTTFIDGVPQLNSYSSNIELTDVNQVEFVRGPQGALFGRNTAGGLINITSRRPAPSWTSQAEVNFGNYDYRDVRGTVSGPLSGDQLDFSLGGGFSTRDGYTRNDFNGADVDSREDGFGKGQLLFKPTDQLELRLILSGESDHDGDYALGDLDYIRAHPHHVNRDFTGGLNNRNIASPTLLVNYSGEKIEASSISGGVWWRTRSLTDLDYGVASPSNFFLNATRDNREEQWQFTQEFRLASSKDNPVDLGESLRLAWQSGLFVFSQSYDQTAANIFAPPLDFQSGQSTANLDNWGLGLYGQAKLEFLEHFSLSAGLRWDYEDKDARLGSSLTPETSLSDTFSEVSPQVALSWQAASNHLVYVSAARGYKAGGFNAPPAGFPAPAGTQEYGAEHSWNYEAGYKARWLNDRLQTTVALFYIDWRDIQLNQQLPFSGGQYYIANAGAAASKGVEFAVNYRPVTGWDLFGSVGYVNAEFLSGSSAFNPNLSPPFGANQDVTGNRLPFTPDFTGNVGTQFSWAVCRAATLYARAMVTVTGDFSYDASNAQGQSTYSLADFRLGVRSGHWFVEGWVDNAFDTHYVPIAIPYGQLGAPSGYVGESGAPLTYGVRAGAAF